MKKNLWYLSLVFLVGVSVTSANAVDPLQKRPRYLLHAGDTVELNYRVTPEFNQVATLQPDGYVNLNLVGEMKLAGLSVQEAHDRILEKASQRLNHPELNLILKDSDKSYVVVAGEVEHPGRFELREDLTALQAIMMAGGFKSSGYDNHVYLYRRINSDQSEVRKLNLHKVVKTNDLERDAQLQPGDLIMVPPNKIEKFSRVVKAASLYVDPATLH